MQKDLQTMFTKSSFSISTEPYFYCQALSYPSDPKKHFLVTDDGEEITVVTKKIVGFEVKEKNPNNWLLISLNLQTPFMKGTLFNVSKTIYESDSNILIVSTYSKDLLLIKEQDKEKVKTALIKLGFAYKEDLTK
jgi:hypothetical protein